MNQRRKGIPPFEWVILKSLYLKINLCYFTPHHTQKAVKKCVRKGWAREKSEGGYEITSYGKKIMRRKYKFGDK